MDMNFGFFKSNESRIQMYENESFIPKVEILSRNQIPRSIDSSLSHYYCTSQQSIGNLYQSHTSKNRTSIDLRVGSFGGGLGSGKALWIQVAMGVSLKVVSLEG